MALTDLTGTKWLLNTIITIPSSDITYTINGSNEWTDHQGQYEGNFSQLKFWYADVGGDDRQIPNMSVIDNGTQYDLYFFAAWQGQNPLILSFTGGTDATNPTLISWIQANAEQVIDAGVKLLKSGTSVIGKINGHYVSSVNGTNVMSGIVADTPTTSYEVTVTFQNGTDTAYWRSTRIFDDFDTTDGSIPATAQQIGSISSADGSTTVTTTTGKLAIFSQGGALLGFPEPNITGEIVNRTNQLGFYGEETGALWAFNVTGNGTISISGMIWDD